MESRSTLLLLFDQAMFLIFTISKSKQHGDTSCAIEKELATKETWGELLNYEPYGRHGDTKHDFKLISLEAADTEYVDYEHVVHGMLYARDDKRLWKNESTKANVLMQMRFDGRLGFPGGHVDKEEDTVAALNRELHEEIGLDLAVCSFLVDDYAVTYLHEEKKFVLHFYIKEITMDIMKMIEDKSVYAAEYGIEILGNIRPPLYTMKDSYRGLPAFLRNTFAGNAREELLFGLIHTQLFTGEEIDKAVELYHMSDNAHKII